MQGNLRQWDDDRSAFETAGKTASSPRAESHASAAQRPPASASIPAYLQAGNPTEMLGVSGHEGRIVDDRRCRDQKVHRGDRPAAAAQRGQKPRVGWRESFVRVAHDEAATEPPNTLPLDGGTLRALRTRDQLAHDVDSDAYLFTCDLLEEHRGRSTDTACRIAEEIDQERSIRVDHSLMRRAGLDRRAFVKLGVAGGAGALVAACGWDGGNAIRPDLLAVSRLNDWVGEKILFSPSRLARTAVWCPCAARRSLFNRGTSSPGPPHTLSRAPLRRRAPFAWLARCRSLTLFAGASLE